MSLGRYMKEIDDYISKLTIEGIAKQNLDQREAFFKFHAGSKSEDPEIFPKNYERKK